MLLAIDTATRVMSLALHDGAVLIAEETWRAGNQHSTQLAPAIQQMMENCQIAVEDLTALAVSTGPGSYTGLRIGIALAKGMAAVNHLPLVGVTTLDTLAAGQPQYQPRHGLITAVQAGRGRIIVQSYHWSKGRWVGRGEPRLMDWRGLMDSVDGPAYLTGEIDATGRAAVEIAQAKKIPVLLAPPAYRLRRAGFLAEEAWERLKTGKDGDFAADRVMPVYVKSDDED